MSSKRLPGKVLFKIKNNLTFLEKIINEVKKSKYVKKIIVAIPSLKSDDVIAKAVANLRHFSVYGTLEQMDKWQEDFNQRFSTRINIASKNTSPNRGASSAITSNPKLMGVITELNRVDQAIYDAVYAMVNDKQTLQARAS